MLRSALTTPYKSMQGMHCQLHTLSGSASHPPTTAHSIPPTINKHRATSIITTAGKRDKPTNNNKSNKDSTKRGKQSSRDTSSTTATPTSLAQLKADEILFFTPNPPPRDGTALNVVYAYPNEYTVGITSLGYQLVWAFFETHPRCAVYRHFTNVGDTLPPLKDTHLLGFSLAWELDYANLMTTLETMGIPLNTADRDDNHPLVFGGGPVLTANPEPFAELFDVVLLGDGEDMLVHFTDKILQIRDEKRNQEGQEGGASPTRQELLEALATVPGCYIPQFYTPIYESDTGPMVDIRVTNPVALEKVVKQTYKGSTLASSTVVSPHMAWESIFMVEVVRSCPEMCRFCLAYYLKLPFRPADLEGSLIPTIEKGLEATKRIGLLGASVTQHPEFPTLLNWLLQPERKDIRLSIASVRTNTVTEELATALANHGTRSLTVAVESGSERIRRVVNKKLSQEEIVKCAVNAQQGGLEGLKLYGMVGVPGEEETDIDATIEMLATIKKTAPKLRLTFGCSTFVPKSHTPFQYYGVNPAAESRLKRLEKALSKKGIDFRPESYKWSLVQGLLSRGDRRLMPLLLLTRELGDSLGSFRRAFKELRGSLPPMEYYVHEQYIPGCVLPWSHLQGPLPEGTLIKHLGEAQMHMAVDNSGGGGEVEESVTESIITSSV